MLTTNQRLSMLEYPKHIVDVVIDTDAYNEIDDQFAISYAMKATEKICVKAIYAAPFLNNRVSSVADGMERSYDEIAKLLRLGNFSTHVFRGSTSYLSDESTPVLSDAAKDLAHRAMKYSQQNPLYILAIGAITNIASAILIQPNIVERIVIVWLGGNALEWPDNSEFNCMQDVAAARVVFDSGAPLVILPCMGVVSAFATSGPELHMWLDGKNELCDYLVRNAEEAANEYAAGKVWSRIIWDATSVGWILNERGCFMYDKLIPTPIPQYDNYWSMNSSRPFCKYVYYISRDELMTDMFEHLIK